MRGKVARKLRRQAENETVGKSKAETKYLYRRLKKNHVRAKAL